MRDLRHVVDLDGPVFVSGRERPAVGREGDDGRAPGMNQPPAVDRVEEDHLIQVLVIPVAKDVCIDGLHQAD